MFRDAQSIVRLMATFQTGAAVDKSKFPRPAFWAAKDWDTYQDKCLQELSALMQVNKWVNECVNECVNEWVNEWVDEYI